MPARPDSAATLDGCLVADYEAMLGEVLGKLAPDNHTLAVALAGIPEKIRGFGHVKARHLAAAKADAVVGVSEVGYGAARHDGAIIGRCSRRR